MKRAKKLYTLLGVLLVVCLAAFGVTQWEQHKEAIRNSDQVVLEVLPEKVHALSWKNETEELAFHKEESWVYDKDGAFPVSEEKINEMLELFRAFGASFIIEDVEDFGQYGLDKPVCTIQMETDEESYQVTLGDFSQMDAQRYVSIGDGNVYLVQNDPLNYFDATLRDMIAHDPTPDFDHVTEVQFSGTETYEITYQQDSTETYCAQDVYFTELDGAVLPLDTTLVNTYLENVSWLNPTNYVTYNATDADLQTYGLDNPELSLTVQYVNKDENEQDVPGTFVLHVARDPEEKAKAAEAAAEDETGSTETEITAYARIGDSKIIYQITSEQYQQLMAASRNDLRHQEVLSADFADVNQIDISLDGSSYTITAQEEQEEKTYFYQDEEMEISELSQALSALTATSFTNEKPTQKEEINLTVHLDNEYFPTVNIQLYRYDGSDCLAVVDGEPVCLVKRSQVVDLIEAVNAIVLS